MAPTLEDLKPDRSQRDRLGAELRRWRVQRNLSQDRLGLSICHSGALVRKIERAERSAMLEFCERADTVLETGAHLPLWVSAATETMVGRSRCRGGRQCASGAGLQIEPDRAMINLTLMKPCRARAEPA